MQRTVTLIFLASTIFLTSFVTDGDRTFIFGKRTCSLKKNGKNNNLASFVSLHDDENTAVDAYLSIANTFNDIALFEIHQNNERLLKYELNNKIFLFDPNRIFSVTGIEKTLLNYNKQFPGQLKGKIKSFSDSLLSIITPKNKNKYIISIHNNSDAGFSALTYKNSKDAKDLFISSNEDTDDFFIVTTLADFVYLKEQNQNVVLQSENAEDDGSLSVYSQKKGIPYINIEAQHGHKAKQIKMIQLVYSFIKNKQL